MSSSLIVYIRKKDHIENDHGICLLDLSTTPARELMNILSSTVYEDDEEIVDKYYKILSWDKINEILQYYSDNINECKKLIKQHDKEIGVLESRIAKVKSIEIYNHIEEQMFSLKELLNQAKEDQKQYESLYDNWQFSVKDVYLENLNYDEYEYKNDCQIPIDGKGQYELIYYLG